MYSCPFSNLFSALLRLMEMHIDSVSDYKLACVWLLRCDYIGMEAVLDRTLSGSAVELFAG